MNCQQVQPALSAYLDDAVEAAAHDRIAAHLVICADCATELQALRRLGELAGTWLAAPAETALKYRILNAVAGQEVAIRNCPWNRLRRQLRPLRVTTAIAFGLALLATRSGLRSPQPRARPAVIATAPLRGSQLSGWEARPTTSVTMRSTVATPVPPEHTMTPGFSALIPRLSALTAEVDENPQLAVEGPELVSTSAPLPTQPDAPAEPEAAPPRMMMAEVPASMMPADYEEARESESTGAALEQASEAASA